MMVVGMRMRVRSGHRSDLRAVHGRRRGDPRVDQRGGADTVTAEPFVPDLRRPWPRWRRYVFHLVLLVGLIGLVPLAHALPPDQTWIAGSYDADDLDDAVTCAVSIDAATKAHRVSAKPLWLAGDGSRPGLPDLGLDPMAPDDPFAVLPDVRRTDSARSPPLAATASVH